MKRDLRRRSVCRRWKFLCWVAVLISAIGNFSLLFRQQTEAQLIHTSTKLTRRYDEIHAFPRFVPFPHNPLPSSETCQWISVNLSSPTKWSSTEHAIVQSMIGHTNVSKVDLIQQAAFRDSICIPKNRSTDDNRTDPSADADVPTSSLPPSLHIFSMREARTCLAHHNVSLIIAGDSYNTNLYMGLTEILEGKKPLDGLIRNHATRNRLTRERAQVMEGILHNETLDYQHHHKQRHYPIHWEVRHGLSCALECHMLQKITSFAHNCSSCINRLIQDATTTERGTSNAVSTAIPHRPRTKIIPVLSVFIHVFRIMGEDPQKTMAELDRFFGLVDGPFLWVSPPYYHMTKVPQEYRSRMAGANALLTNHDHFANALLTNHDHFVKHIATKWSHKVRVLDIQALTRACVWKRCTVDGGHYSRFVNRWKAQLLLNMICQ